MLAAAFIARDLCRHPQPMRIMNAVWILTGLWAGLLGLWAYYNFGRAMTTPCKDMHNMKGMEMRREGAMQMKKKPDMSDMEQMKDSTDMKDMDMHRTEMKSTTKMRMPQMTGMKMPMNGSRPHWQSVVLSTLHCGAGCTLADVLGEWLLYFIPIAVGGSLIAGGWVVDYLLALAIGIGFQYAAIRGMEHISRSRAIAHAAKADLLSLTAWQVGMYGWMAVVIFVFNDGALPLRTTWWFWFMMQVAMGCGFLTALPMNAWLIRKGIKKGM